MKAEAANELGDGATAESMLELVRARARAEPVAYCRMSPSRRRQRYENRHQERTALGVCMEGVRFYDLVRWGDALSVLGLLGYTSRCNYYPIPRRLLTFSGGVADPKPLW